MFFIMGIYDKTKEIDYNGSMEICSECGRYCSYKIFVTYKLTKEQGRKTEKGEKITNKEL